MSTAAIVRAIKASNPAVTVIQQNQNGERPDLPYFAVFCNEIDTVGGHDYKFPVDTATNTRELVKNAEYMANIQYFGDNPSQVLKSEVRKLIIDPSKSILNQAGLCYIENMPVIDITEVQDTKYEPRATVDVRFRAGEAITESDVYTIETGEIQASTIGNTENQRTINI